MSQVKLLPILILAALVGCTHIKSEHKMSGMCKHHKHHEISVIPNTNTAIVGLPLTKEQKLPKKLEKLEIMVKPGQKIVFAGPDRFEIFAKDTNFSILKSRDVEECTKPSKDCIESKDGVINITIPKEVFKLRQVNTNKEIIVPFGIRINGDEIDPRIIIKEDN